MSKAAEQPKSMAGNFIASFVHPKTGKRIFAKDYGKKAFFIPSGKSLDTSLKEEASK